MATPLRELIGRFRLESKPEDFKQINKAVDGVKGGMKSLAAVMGVTFGIAGGVALAKTGLGAKRAAFQLERFAGVDLKPLNEQFKAIKKDLNQFGGIGETFNKKQFDTAAVDFIKAFGSEKIKDQTFGKLFRFAAAQAELAGKDVTDVMHDLQQGILGGGFDTLQEIPGFDIFKKKMLEFQQEVINPNEPGGKIAIENRMKMMRDIIDKATPEQNKSLSAFPKEIVNADIAANKLQDTLQNIGSLLLNLANDILPKLVNILKKIDEFIGDTKGDSGKNNTSLTSTMIAKAVTALPGVDDSPQNQKGAAKMFDKLGHAIANPMGDTPEQIQATKESWGGFAHFGDQKSWQEEQQKKLGLGGQAVEIHNTFHISSTEPAQVGDEVQKRFSESLRGARISLVPTEAR